MLIADPFRWFFMVFSDGIFLLIITKLRQSLQRQDGLASVKFSHNQILGFILLNLAGSMTLFVLKSSAVVLCGLYQMMSAAEHLILETTSRRVAKQWTLSDMREALESVPERTIDLDEETSGLVRKRSES